MDAWIILTVIAILLTAGALLLIRAGEGHLKPDRDRQRGQLGPSRREPTARPLPRWLHSVINRPPERGTSLTVIAPRSILVLAVLFLASLAPAESPVPVFSGLTTRSCAGLTTQSCVPPSPLYEICDTVEGIYSCNCQCTHLYAEAVQ